VLFTESLPGLAWSRAEAAINKLQKGDVMLVIGTSSVVYPAASLPEMASRKGATVVEVNLDHPTPLSDVANICVQGKAADVLQEMVSMVCS
jgi:NAD-dependent deacetylase